MILNNTKSYNIQYLIFYVRKSDIRYFISVNINMGCYSKKKVYLYTTYIYV